ncbi:MAG TPA: peptidoglycan-binding protein [Nakamurella sp.]
MADCARCGARDQAGRFCVNCGTPVAAPTQRVNLVKPPGVGPADPTVLTGPGSGSNWAPTGTYPVPAQTAPQPLPPPGSRRRGRGPAALVVLAVAVLLVAGVGVWFMIRPVGGDGGAVAVRASTGASGGVTGGPGTGTESAGAPTMPAAVAPPGSKNDPGPTTPPTTAATTTVLTTTVSVDPMGGPRADIACGSGYIVQVASELDQPAFTARVAALRATGTLPADVKWTETSSSCEIFTNQRNVLVLYAGPYASVADACPARLSSPADAFVKVADPAAVGTFRACLCPATAAALVPVTTVGQQDVWVGELQRVLGAGLDYNVGSINADPSIGDPGRWGTYTAETAAAVGRFQSDRGLPVTQQVDATTWSALQAAWCGQE